MANLKTKYWIEANDIKTNLPKQHDTGMFRSLDDIIRDVLKCCGIDCCEGIYPGSGVGTNLGYIAFPTKGTVTSSTGTSTDVPVVNAINAGLATTTMFINSHVPVTTVAGSVIITQSGIDNQTLKADITGIATATSGQVASTDGAGNIVWTTPSSGVTDLAYTPSATNGIVVSSTGTDATISAVDNTNAGLATPAMLLNSHVPATFNDSGTIDFTVSGTDNQTVTATLLGVSGATIGQVPQSDGAGNITWVTPTSATNLTYTASPTQGTVLSDTGTDAIIPSVTVTDAGLATPSLLANSHVPVTTTAGTVTITQSGTDNQTLKADITGIDTATIGQIPSTDGAGNVVWVAQTPSQNIYNSDGTLTGNRTVDQNGNSLIINTTYAGSGLETHIEQSNNIAGIGGEGVGFWTENTDGYLSALYASGGIAVNSSQNAANTQFSRTINMAGIGYQFAGMSVSDGTTQNDFNVNTTDITVSQYPNTRDDSGITTPTNVLYTDASGKFLSAPVSSIVSADNGLYVIGGITKLGGQLIEDTVIVGELDKSITIAIADAALTEINKLQINSAGVNLKSEGIGETSEIILNDGELSLRGETILKVITNGTPTSPNGSVLTLIDNLTGEAEWQPAATTINEWHTTGNVGTDGGATNFVGTTDAQDLVLKTNSTEIARFGTTPNYSISLHDNNNISSGFHSLAIGSYTQATGYSSFSGGDGAAATGDVSFAFGTSSQATAQDAIAIASSVANGEQSFSVSSSVTNGYGSFAAAQGTANGASSFAVIKGKTNGDYSVAFGDGIESQSYSEYSLGSFNTLYTPIDPIAFNPADRLFTIGNGINTAARNNALTMWKDGRSMWNGDVAKQNTWIGVNGTDAQNFINVTTPAGNLAAISTEHTPSGNYVVLGSNNGNSGLVINDTKQFAFTTTAGTTSTQLGATSTVANYSSTGFLFGGGGAASSTVDIRGTLGLSNTRISTANPILTVNNSVYHFTSGTTGTVNMTAMVVDNRTFVLTNYSGVSLTLSNAIRTGSATTTTTLTDNTSMTIAYDGVEFFKIA